MDATDAPTWPEAPTERIEPPTEELSDTLWLRTDWLIATLEEEETDQRELGCNVIATAIRSHSEPQ